MLKIVSKLNRSSKRGMILGVSLFLVALAAISSVLMVRTLLDQQNMNNRRREVNRAFYEGEAGVALVQHWGNFPADFGVSGYTTLFNYSLPTGTYDSGTLQDRFPTLYNTLTNNNGTFTITSTMLDSISTSSGQPHIGTFKAADNHILGKTKQIQLIKPGSSGAPTVPSGYTCDLIVRSLGESVLGRQHTVIAYLDVSPLSLTSAGSPAALVSFSTASIGGNVKVHWGQAWSKKRFTLESRNNLSYLSSAANNYDQWAIYKTEAQKLTAAQAFNASTTITDGYVLASNMTLPAQTTLNNGTALPANQSLGAGTQMYSGDKLPASTVIPGTTSIPSGTTLPGGTTLPATEVVPSSSVLPSGTVLSASTVVPNNTTLPTGTVLPAGMVFPSGSYVNGTHYTGSSTYTVPAGGVTVSSRTETGGASTVPSGKTLSLGGSTTLGGSMTLPAALVLGSGTMTLGGAMSVPSSATLTVGSGGTMNLGGTMNIPDNKSITLPSRTIFYSGIRVPANTTLNGNTAFASAAYITEGTTLPANTTIPINSSTISPIMFPNSWQWGSGQEVYNTDSTTGAGFNSSGGDYALDILQQQPGLSPASGNYGGAFIQDLPVGVLNWPDFASNYQNFKNIAIAHGRYYTTNASGQILKNGVAVDFDTEFGAVNRDALPYDLVFIDTIDQQPPNSSGSNLITIHVSGQSQGLKGIFYLCANFDASGQGSPPTLGTAQKPDGTNVSLNSIYLDGLLYSAGTCAMSGNRGVYGSVVCQRGFTGQGTPDIYYNWRLANGIPLENGNSGSRFRVVLEGNY